MKTKVIGNSVQDFTADGTTSGIITVSNARNLWPGSYAFVNADSQTGVKVVIAEILDAHQVRLIKHPDEGCTPSGRFIQFIGTQVPDLSAYTVVAHGAITVPSQTVYPAYIVGGAVVEKNENFWE
jgi:hypothetical protein